MSEIDDSGRDWSATERSRAGLGAPRRESGPAADGPVPPSLSSIAGQRGLDRRVTTLSTAIRRARLENAERASGVEDLRGAEIARLDILREQLDPILEQLPKDCDLFDVAIQPSERPRLFIDAIGFVELADDRRSYRFVQDTRHGRIEICNNPRTEALVEAITAYIAHRLVEREKALASDYASGVGAAQAARAAAARQAQMAMSPKRSLRRRATDAYLFLVEVCFASLTFALLFLLIVWIVRRIGGE